MYVEETGWRPAPVGAIGGILRYRRPLLGDAPAAARIDGSSVTGFTVGSAAPEPPVKLVSTTQTETSSGGLLDTILASPYLKWGGIAVAALLVVRWMRR